MSVDLHQRQFIILSVQMARTKNVGGGPGDDDRRPLPRKPAGPKGKATKQVTSKKRKYPDAETARVLEAIIRRTLLPRLGCREGLTRLQLWLLNALMQQTVFDIWDLLLLEMEDTIAEGFKGHR